MRFIISIEHPSSKKVTKSIIYEGSEEEFVALKTNIYEVYDKGGVIDFQDSDGNYIIFGRDIVKSSMINIKIIDPE